MSLSLTAPTSPSQNRTEGEILGKLPPREKAWQAAKRFEGIFIQMLVRDMRKNAESFGEGMFGKAPGSGVQSQLFNSLLSDKMAQSGRIGLARALMEDWERQRLIPKETLHSPAESKKLELNKNDQGLAVDEALLRELQNG